MRSQSATMAYEPKWDGFRCLAFRDGKDVFLQSKADSPCPLLSRRGPQIQASKATFVLDGELVVPIGDALSSMSCNAIAPGASAACKNSRGASSCG